MISDIFSETVAATREYLDDADTCYTGPIRERIEAAIAELDAIRVILDTPPLMFIEDSQSCHCERHPDDDDGQTYGDPRDEMAERLDRD